MRIIKTTILVTTAILSGLLVLIGYYIDIPILLALRALILQWAVLLAAVAFFVGIINLTRVHWVRVSENHPDKAYSIVLIISLVCTLIIVGFNGPTSSISLWIYNFILVPIESSLLAILVVVLVSAAVRMVFWRNNSISLIFIITVLIVLFGTVTLPGFRIPGLGELNSWIKQVPAIAGARGILMGVALGSIATGLRILLGADRLYGG
jgi:hypothetical protein